MPPSTPPGTRYAPRQDRGKPFWSADRQKAPAAPPAPPRAVPGAVAPTGAGWITCRVNTAALETAIRDYLADCEETHEAPLEEDLMQLIAAQTSFTALPPQDS